MEVTSEKSVLVLVGKIMDSIEGHDRLEAIDALDVARILMRSNQGHAQPHSEVHGAER